MSNRTQMSSSTTSLAGCANTSRSIAGQKPCYSASTECGARCKDCERLRRTGRNSRSHWPVNEDVAERVTRLARVGDDLGVVSIREHGASPPRPWPAPADRRVEVLGRRDLEALHPRGERALVLGLDDQVQVGALDAEVDDAKVLAQRGGQRGLAHRLVGGTPAQVADHGQDA